MKFLQIFFLILIPFFSYTQDFEKVDRFVASLKLDKTITIDNLAKEITKPFKTDIDKVRAIYYWQAENIIYDYQGFKSNYWTNYPSEDSLINNTFKFRKGVCSGYAHLFKYMLEQCDIESEVITGYARNSLETIFLNETNHDWNVVKIDKKWYLFDVTWARNTLKKKVDNFWFMTSPDIFILNHFPEESSWTLTSKKYSLDEYMNFPIYSNLFFETKFTKEISKKGHFVASNGSVRILLKPTIDCTIICKLYDPETKEWSSPKIVDKTKLSGYIDLTLEKKGKFVVQIGAIEKCGSGFFTYDNLMYYTIENK